MVAVCGDRRHNQRVKVVRKSNFNHEGHRGDQFFVAQRMTPTQAKHVADALNGLEHEHSDDFYVAVDDDYVLPPDWAP